MPRKDRANLLAVLDAIEKILHYIEAITSADDCQASPMAFDATLMNFVVIG